MESMVEMKSLFGGIYNGKKVLITGHTGFKGSWIATWLKLLGAEVYGYALKPITKPSHIDILQLNINEKIDDIRNFEILYEYINEIQPDIVFHLAAQALVRESYKNPIDTYSTNVMGTLNLFEACRKVKSVRAIVNITSDKCYENREWIWGYRENDPMGGFDPYSSSKGCSELLTTSFRNSFFNIKVFGVKHNVLLASARAGNVIGGGDWSSDRLIPDIVKAASEKNEVIIRSPNATRPWQHVLEPLSGYLTLGWKLLESKFEYADGWNFGPEMTSNLTVREVITYTMKYWDVFKINYLNSNDNPHEANLLMLDCSKANKLLKWRPVWLIEQTIQKTIEWYKNFYLNNEISTYKDINEYIEQAFTLKRIWTL